MTQFYYSGVKIKIVETFHINIIFGQTIIRQKWIVSYKQFSEFWIVFIKTKKKKN